MIDLNNSMKRVRSIIIQIKRKVHNCNIDSNNNSNNNNCIYVFKINNLNYEHNYGVYNDDE